MSHPLPEMLNGVMDKVRTLADANTVMGSPITTPDGVTLIPVSKISFGYAGGGTDFNTKHTGERANPFGGGTGGGVNVTPVAFLVIREGNVRVLPIQEPAANSVDRLLDMLPELIEKLNSIVKKKPEEAADEDVEA